MILTIQNERIYSNIEVQYLVTDEKMNSLLPSYERC